MMPWEAAGLSQDTFRRLPLRARVAIVSSLFLGWRYSLTAPRVPFKLGSLPLGLVTAFGGKTNCSTATAAILMGCFPEAPWTLREYGDLQVFADRLPGLPDSPIRAIERVGIGSRVTAPVANCVHLVQGWRKIGPNAADFRGHAVLVVVGEDPTRLLVLEATSRDSALGVRWRETTLDDFRAEFPAAIYFGALGAS